MAIFHQVKGANVQKSAFDLSHERKLSLGMGYLVPVLCMEVLPGDKITIDSQHLIRFMPLVAPLMHRINAYIHFFYIPNRILWEDWEDFITGDLETTVPLETLNGKNISQDGLADHMGIPLGNYSNTTEEVNLLPFRAYYAIWNEYYRDENIHSAVDIETIDGTTLPILTQSLKKRAWGKDYFTSCLPWTQKGTAVSVEADIDYKDIAVLRDSFNPTGTLSTEDLQLVTAGVGTGTGYMEGKTTGHEFGVEGLESINIDINELRTATRLQRWLERNARAGSRYVEHLLAHWGIKSSDARLDRPEYIGGGKAPIVISEVVNNTGFTSGEEYALPQGNLAGHGISVGTTNKAYKFCEEHGYIMAIMSVIPDTAYYQGLHKMFSRHTNLDFYYPEFAQLGEQAVLTKELYFQDTATGANDTEFGYQSRWAEYKYMSSQVAGSFRKETNMLQYHLARTFSSTPTLSNSFLNCTPDTRIFAVETEQSLYCQIYHRIKAIRPMPFFNDPKL